MSWASFPHTSQQFVIAIMTISPLNSMHSLFRPIPLIKLQPIFHHLQFLPPLHCCGSVPISSSSSSAAAADMTKLRHIASPTTFVCADTGNFRDLVQKLTGGSTDEEDQENQGGASIRNSNTLGGLHVGPKKSSSSFKFQAPRRLEIHRSGGARSMAGEPLLSLALPQLLYNGNSNPVSPADSSQHNFSCVSTPSSDVSASANSCVSDADLCCVQASWTPRTREPELLPLFPLHSADETRL